MSTFESPWLLLLDPRSDFYAMHPDLKPMLYFCLLRSVSQEFLATAGASP